MKISIFILLNLLLNYSSLTQIKPIYDFHYGKFIIGFEIEIKANEHTIIEISSDSTEERYKIFDSTLANNENVHFIYFEYFEKEKSYSSQGFTRKIPEIQPGTYSIIILRSYKFIYLK